MLPYQAECEQGRCLFALAVFSMGTNRKCIDCRSVNVCWCLLPFIVQDEASCGHIASSQVVAFPNKYLF